MIFYNMYIPYSRKISKGLIFKNFKSSQAFSKTFFEINEVIMHMYFRNVSQLPANNGTSEIF